VRKAGEGINGAAVAASADAPGPMVRGHAGAAAAATRSHAVLRLLLAGPCSVADLRASLPVATGSNAAQHSQGVSNALYRLRDNGLVANSGGGWSLTAKGRRAAGAAKEAP